MNIPVRIIVVKTCTITKFITLDWIDKFNELPTSYFELNHPDSGMKPSGFNHPDSGMKPEC